MNDKKTRALETVIELWGGEIAKHYEWCKESLHFLNDLRTIAKRTSWTGAVPLLNKTILDKESLWRRKRHCSTRPIKQTHLKEVLNCMRDTSGIEDVVTDHTEKHVRAKSEVADRPRDHQSFMTETGKPDSDKINSKGLAYDQYGILVSISEPHRCIKHVLQDETQAHDDQKLVRACDQTVKKKMLGEGNSHTDGRSILPLHKSDQLGAHPSAHLFTEPVEAKDCFENVLGLMDHESSQPIDARSPTVRADVIDFKQPEHKDHSQKICCSVCQGRLASIEEELATLRSAFELFQPQRDTVSSECRLPHKTGLHD